MKAKRLWENVIHGWFLLMGLVTVGCVLLITVYLIISGIPAIREIGLIKFLFGPVWDSNGTPPQFGILSFILTSIYGTAGPGKAESRRLLGSQPAGGHSLGGVRPCGYAGAGARHPEDLPYS